MSIVISNISVFQTVGSKKKKKNVPFPCVPPRPFPLNSFYDILSSSCWMVLTTSNTWRAKQASQVSRHWNGNLQQVMNHSAGGRFQCIWPGTAGQAYSDEIDFFLKMVSKFVKVWWHRLKCLRNNDSNIIFTLIELQLLIIPVIY